MSFIIIYYSILEYGEDWRSPLPLWDYANSPQNNGPIIPFTFTNISQEEQYYK